MGTVSIPLGSRKYPGHFAVVDEEDATCVLAHRWSLFRTDDVLHAARMSKTDDGKRRRIFLHNFLMESPVGMEIDHVDRNGLNCTRGNMRHCTHGQNMLNRGRHKDSSAPFKGVTLSSKGDGWIAKIGLAGATHYIGLFTDPLDAARAYDAKARELHGEFAQTNFRDDAQPAPLPDRRVQSTSGYTGVSLRKETGKWRAYTNRGERHIHLGYFATMEEAIQARDKALQSA